jgi:DNA-binding transcriptional LysR family regulator
MAMLNLSDLSVFVTAAESKSFSEAGRRLHLSQPAVSQTIEKLEKEFETHLFLRQGRRMRLSETGLALLPMARDLLASATRVEESMACLQGEIVGELIVGCSTTTGRYLLPGLVAAFRKERPQVGIRALASGWETVSDRLQTGELSLAITSQQLDHRDLDCQDFFVDEMSLIVPADHPWAGCQQVLPIDLLDEPIILREEAAGTQQVLLEALTQHGLAPEMMKVSMVLGDPETIVMAVEEGLGVAFVSRLAAARSLECGRVAEVKLAGMELRRKIYLTRSRRIPQTLAQASFWDFVTHERAGEFVSSRLVSSHTLERQLS